MGGQHYSIKTLLIVIIILLALPGCGQKSYDRVPNPNMGVGQLRVKTGGLLQNAALQDTLRIGTEGNYPPFSYHGTGGRLTGFDVEIAEEVARHMEMKAVFVEAKWKDLLPGLTEGKYDAVFNEVADNRNRRALYDFSNPYMTSTPVLVVRSNEKNIRAFTDLKGKTTAVEAVGEYQQIAAKYQSKAVVTKDFTEAANLLVNRKVDAVLTDSLSILNLRQQTPDLPVKTAYSLDYVNQVCAVFAKGNSDLVAAIDNALETMQADGSYLTIWKKYFGDSPSAYKGIIDREK
ncbi:transporter substrate-binding domain-containing protein [Paenibacillus sp. N3/727]|uniref:transporter substrate-binding domain-containing protein n=1 Tax=Paenibacillus sp. N3/727 TaxID=2925845 RepID=UPI001F53A77C|nr:transporter substrate-binding domain-containing protein [Paenibacillus sp. N3/727]UNK19934.1 transporter substrate-binding domain-containing protein [Paenibacillus sp. N3/727]